ncbi:MAG: hypothetical protein GY940_11480 [bacterium]|nr:hypothetical protein [bacterium]
MTLRNTIKFLIFGLFLFFQAYLFFLKEIEVLDYPDYINEHPLPLFGDNKKVSQEFRTPGPLTRIDIMLANYLVKPGSGTLRLTIFNGKRRLYFKNFPANTAEDNRFYSFPIDSPTIPQGNYRLRLNYFPGDKTEKLAAWISETDRYPYGDLYVNGKKRNGDMTFRVYYASTVWKEKQRWLDGVPEFPARAYLLPAGFLLLLFMLNLLFYFFLETLIKDKSDIHGID